MSTENKKNSLFESISSGFKNLGRKRPMKLPLDKHPLDTIDNRRQSQSSCNTDNALKKNTDTVDSNKILKQDAGDRNIKSGISDSNLKLSSMKNSAIKIASDDVGVKVLNREVEESDVLPESIVDLNLQSQEHLNLKSPSNNEKTFDFKIEPLSPIMIENGLKIKTDKLPKGIDDFSLNETPKTLKRNVTFKQNNIEIDQSEDPHKDSRAPLNAFDSMGFSPNNSIIKSNFSSPNTSFFKRQKTNKGDQENNEALVINDKYIDNTKNALIQLMVIGSEDHKAEEQESLKNKELVISTYNRTESVHIKDIPKNSLAQLTDFSSLTPINKHTKESMRRAVDSSPLRKTGMALMLHKKENTCRNVVFFILFLLLSFAALATIASMITYSYPEVLYLWIGNFFHGLFLGLLTFVFFKAMMREILQNFEEINKGTRTISKEEFSSKFGGFDVTIIAGTLAVLSGLIMVAIERYDHRVLHNPFSFIAIELSILCMNSTCLWCLFFIKKYYETKKINQIKSPGFFSVAVYKDFVNDFKNTKEVLSDRGSIDNFSPKSTRSNKPIQKTYY